MTTTVDSVTKTPGFFDGNGHGTYAGDIVEYQFGARRGLLLEVLQDGDAFVFFFDVKATASVKWKHLCKVVPEAAPPPDKVYDLGPHINMSPTEALSVAARREWDDIIIFGVYKDDDTLRMMSSGMTRERALWLTEHLKAHTLNM